MMLSRCIEVDVNNFDKFDDRQTHDSMAIYYSTTSDMRNPYIAKSRNAICYFSYSRYNHIISYQDNV